MQKYTNYKCPVCNEQFTENDDIVTCPECGTPHHRDCYNLSGHCVNQGLHQNNYVFLDSEKPIEDNNAEQVPNGAYYVPNNSQPAPEQKQEERPFTPFTPYQFAQNEVEEKGSIDGVEIEDIKATVRSNYQIFIDKFKKFSASKKKASWNWGAFIFGPFYLFFRKMYKHGIAFMCLNLTASICTLTALYNFAPEYMNKMSELAASYSSSFSTASSKVLEDLTTVPNSEAVSIIGTVFIIVLLILRIIQGAFADYFYKGTVFEIIKNVEKRIEDGDEITPTVFMIGQPQTLNQKQIKKFYLANKGGVSFFAPVLAYFASEIIMNLVLRFF